MKFAVIFVIFVAFRFCRGLDIEFNFIQYNWYGLGEKYICSAGIKEEIEVLRRSLSKVIRISGRHYGNRNDEDVLGVVISGQTTFGIVRNFKEFFPNMDQLYVIRSKLKFLYRSDFKGYKALKALSLSRNHLSHLPYDAFNELTNLKYFDISFNQLTQMPNISAMKKLISLYLHENSIEALTKEDLSNNLDLKGIWLYNNNLKYIQASAFEQLHNVRFVDLIHNNCINMARIYYNPQPIIMQ